MIPERPAKRKRRASWILHLSAEEFSAVNKAAGLSGAATGDFILRAVLERTALTLGKLNLDSPPPRFRTAKYRAAEPRPQERHLDPTNEEEFLTKNAKVDALTQQIEDLISMDFGLPPGWDHPEERTQYELARKERSALIDRLLTKRAQLLEEMRSLLSDGP